MYSLNFEYEHWNIVQPNPLRHKSKQKPNPKPLIFRRHSQD
jgi:hypothetical protein